MARPVASLQANTSLWHYNERRQTVRNKLWKLCSLTVFSKPISQSVWILFNFRPSIHSCVFVVLLKWSYTILSVFNLYFTHFVTHFPMSNTIPLNLSVLLVVWLVWSRWSTAREGFSQTKVNCLFTIHQNFGAQLKKINLTKCGKN